MLKNLFILASLALLTQSCQSKPMPTAVAAPKTVESKNKVCAVNKDTTLIIGGFSILIKVPDSSIKIVGDLLLLPGWNYSNTKWCDSTSVCDSALKKGLRVIAPQMMQSVYATIYYPQTRSDLLKYPTLTWLDTSIDILQAQYGFFQESMRFVLGLSTGGRGVALICEKKPNFFTAGAALSGDFDQSKTTNDVLTMLVYGPYHMYKDRWKTIDNPTFGIPSLTTPLYIGHAVNDKVVPYTQSRDFYLAIKKAHPTLNVKFHEEWKLGHTFTYWRSELPAVWNFFDTYMNPEK